MTQLNRRKFLSISAAGAGAVALVASGCASPAAAPVPLATTPAAAATAPVSIASEKELITNVATAAKGFLDGLDENQRAKASYDFANEERVRWHWTTPRNFPRNGLPLTEMNDEQKTRAFALLQSSISAAGYEKARNIIALQRELGNDPDLFFVTIFGAPGGADAWGWRWEGHHLSRHFTVVGDQVAVTPLFHGSWPTTTDAGLRALPREEDAARELINALSEPLRQRAIFQSDTLSRHVTQNQARVSPLEQVGIGYGEMDAEQQARVLEIIQNYLGAMPELLATAAYERISEAGLEQIQFGWAGSLEVRRPQYYRLQGPTFLLEFDNSRNGGTHVHSVWRDFERDFGYHLL